MFRLRPFQRMYASAILMSTHHAKATPYDFYWPHDVFATEIPYTESYFGRAQCWKTFGPDNTDYDVEHYMGLPIELRSGFAPYQFQWMHRKRSKQELQKGYVLHSSQTSRKALAKQHKKPKPVLTKRRVKGIVIAR